MKEGKAESNNKGLIILLCALVVVIVGLGIGIGVVMLNDSRNGSVAENDKNVNGGTEALLTSENIRSKLESDLNYSNDDAIRDYEYALNSNGGNAYKVYVAMDYADFVYDLYMSKDYVIEIMSGVEGLLDTSTLAIDYYGAMSSFYEQFGDTEKADLYNQKVVELVPAETMTQGGIKIEDFGDE